MPPPGAVRWAYDTGGRINASPSIWGNRICIATYAGSLFCLDRRDGDKLWSKYFNRGFFRNQSFYASPSTDGRRIFLVSRVRNGLCGQRPQRRPAVEGPRRSPRLHDARGRRRPGVRRRFRRRAARLQRGKRHGAVAALRQRADPRSARRRRRSRLLLDARDEHVRGAGHEREDRLANRPGEVLAGHRHRPPLLLLAERAARWPSAG